MRAVAEETAEERFANEKQLRDTCRCTGWANNEQFPGKNFYIRNCSKFYHEIYSFYRGGFRPCMRQISL